MIRHVFPRYGWYKSSYSPDEGDDCVEIWVADGLISIRDSKNPTGPMLRITPSAYRSFTRAVTHDTLCVTHRREGVGPQG
ncbi:DUF397 domain-containing protein [Streptomyces olivoreticuli]|uniref:DUF397 domain-containing protein n=1 Tax=Streptomyces olivoreticuli TaxID=68246 RepID=UPI000E2524B3|nr:DUF397 domain-containing protein [Streptomyces olivoreticuli]